MKENIGGVRKVHIVSEVFDWRYLNNFDSNLFISSLSKQVAQDIEFEEVDDKGCSGSKCFFKKVGVRCIVCKMDEIMNNKSGKCNVSGWCF